LSSISLSARVRASAATRRRTTRVCALINNSIGWSSPAQSTIRASRLSSTTGPSMRATWRPTRTATIYCR
jgi:hypothetical protein